MVVLSFLLLCYIHITILECIYQICDDELLKISQLEWLTREVQRMASARPITVLNGNSNQGGNYYFLGNLCNGFFCVHSFHIRIRIFFYFLLPSQTVKFCTYKECNVHELGNPHVGGMIMLAFWSSKFMSLTIFLLQQPCTFFCCFVITDIAFSFRKYFSSYCATRLLGGIGIWISVVESMFYFEVPLKICKHCLWK